MHIGRARIHDIVQFGPFRPGIPRVVGRSSALCVVPLHRAGIGRQRENYNAGVGVPTRGTAWGEFDFLLDDVRGAIRCHNRTEILVHRRNYELPVGMNVLLCSARREQYVVKRTDRRRRDGETGCDRCAESRRQKNLRLSSHFNLLGLLDSIEQQVLGP